MLADEIPSLHTLNFMRCVIPLASRILFSPNLIRLIPDVPEHCDARELLEVLQHTSQLQVFHLSFLCDFSESRHPLFTVQLRYLTDLAIVGGTTSIIKVLENLRLSATVVRVILLCGVPTASLSVSCQVAERLFAALGTARMPYATRQMDPSQPFPPKLFFLQHADPFYRLFTVQENPDPGGDLLTSTNVRFSDEGTGADIPFEEWLPMFTAVSPETLQQMTGWSFAAVSDI